MPDLAQIEVGGLLETGVGRGFRDLEALLPRLDRTRGIAREEKPVRPVDEYPSEAGLIAEGLGLRFRLVQMPAWVSDYVLLHELMHLRQQNHSRRYWRLVEQVCPGFRAAERWLRGEGKALF